MISETGLKIFYWGFYVWFIIGVATIAIPAIYELSKMFSSNSSQPKAKE